MSTERKGAYTTATRAERRFVMESGQEGQLYHPSRQELEDAARRTTQKQKPALQQSK